MSRQTILKKGLSLGLSMCLLLIPLCGCSEAKPTEEPFTATAGLDSVESGEQIKDVSEDFSYKFIGNPNEQIVATDENFIKYKDTDNAFTRTNIIPNVQVSISEDAVAQMKNTLDEHWQDMPYSELFDLEHQMLRRSENAIVSVHKGTFTLANGHVDATELYEVIKNNNNAYSADAVVNAGFFFLEDTELEYVCEIVADALNWEIDTNPYLDIDALCCFLSDMTVLGEENVTLARITTANVLGISRSMIEIVQNDYEGIDVFAATLTHEAKHMPQINCFCELEGLEGNIIGFNQHWDNEPIQSLFWEWYYEASAETMTTNQLGHGNVVYENPTNYLKYLTLTLSAGSDFDIKAVEDVSVSRNEDDFYNLFGAGTSDEKLEIAEIMYAIELIQNEDRDFGTRYLEHMGLDGSILDSDQWIAVKRELKAALATNLAIKFYENLANFVCAGNATMNDLYYLISVYEAEIESHLRYDSIEKFETNRVFMSEYIAIQDTFFAMLETEYAEEDLFANFNKFSFETPVELNGLPDATKEFIAQRQNELIADTTTNIRNYYSILLEQHELIGK